MKTYKKYMEQQEPSEALVEMTHSRMMEAKKKKGTIIPLYRYASVAAVLLCIVGGVWRMGRVENYEYYRADQQIIRAEIPQGDFLQAEKVEIIDCDTLTGKNLQQLSEGFEAQSAERVKQEDGTEYYIVYYKGESGGAQLRFFREDIPALTEELQKAKAYKIAGNMVQFSSSGDGRQLYAFWKEDSGFQYVLQSFGMEKEEFEKLVKKFLS